MRRILLCLSAFLTLSFAISAQDKAADILVLSSHVESSEWVHAMMRPVEELEKERPEFTVSTWFLRLMAHPTVKELQHHVDSCLSAQPLPPRLVVLLGGSCFNFAPDIQQRWPGIPMILLGEQDYYCDTAYTLLGPGDPDAARYPVYNLKEQNYNLTLVCAAPMFRRTVSMILTVQPNLDNLVIVAGENYMSKENLWRLEQYLDKTYPDLPYKVISSASTTTDQLITLLGKETGPNTAVLYISWLVRKDYLENVATRHNTVSLIEHIAPVYTFFATDMEKHPKVMGYYSFSATEYGRNVRQRILDVLDHDIRPSDLPFVYLEADVPTLNYHTMEHFGLDTSLIPQDAEVLYAPRSFWQAYRKEIMWGGFFLLVSMLCLIFFFMTRSLLSLRRARNMAQQADRIKSQFVKNMSREIRAPLNNIVGFSQLLGLPDGTNTEEEKAQYLEYIMNDSQLMMVMVDDMLRVSELDKGKYKVHIAPTNLNAMARQALKSIEYRFPQSIHIIRQPGLAEDALYMADGMRVQQIMVHFLTNACKHSPEDARIVFGSSLVENPGYITFFVEDNGSGAPVEEAESLGLRISEELARSMGGKIWLDTHYAKGNRSVFTIPCEPAPVE